MSPFSSRKHVSELDSTPVDERKLPLVVTDSVFVAAVDLSCQRVDVGSEEELLIGATAVLIGRS